MRLVGRPIEVYQYLEPLYNDYRKIRLRTTGAKFSQVPCLLRSCLERWAPLMRPERGSLIQQCLKLIEPACEAPMHKL